MTVIADTNVLVRVLTRDDPEQAARAEAALATASSIAVPPATFCELAWVLRRLYGKSAADIAKAIRGIAKGRTVVLNAPAVEAGLAMLDAGGDFADGVIAHEGRALGGQTFLSFDTKAIALLRAQGHDAMEPIARR